MPWILYLLFYDIMYVGSNTYGALIIYMLVVLLHYFYCLLFICIYIYVVIYLEMYDRTAYYERLCIGYNTTIYIFVLSIVWRTAMFATVEPSII